MESGRTLVLIHHLRQLPCIHYIQKKQECDDDEASHRILLYSQNMFFLYFVTKKGEHHCKELYTFFT